MKFVWPKAASEVQLIVPRSYRVKGSASSNSDKDDDTGGSSALCHVEYCSRAVIEGGTTSDGESGGGWLKIVSSDESRTVLDVMNVDDVIGASVEFAMTTPTATTSDPAKATGASTIGKTKGGKEEMLELVSPTPRAPSEILADTQGHATLHIYCYPKVSNQLSLLQKLGVKSKPRPRVPDRSMIDNVDSDGYASNNKDTASPRMAAHRAFVLAPVEDLGHIQNLVRAIQQLARSSVATVRERYLVLVNPISGKGHAEADARTTVVPMLEQAGIECEVVVTLHRGHAHEICRDGHDGTDTTKSLLDGVTGIVVVAGDGVFHEVVNALASSNRLEKYKLGMIPCGTGSGLAASMAHYGNEECNVLSSTFTICKGHVVKADTSQYSTTNQKHTSFLTYSWGLVADVDMESECIRWMGTARLDLWAVYRIVFLRTYRGRLSYSTAPATSSLPPITDPVPNDWTVVEDEFVLFWASQVTHASMGFYHSPPTQVGDESFQIMMIRKPMSRLQMIRILLSIDAGEHVGLKGVEFIKCSAYRLEPVGSFNVIDGEMVEAGPVQAHVVPKSMVLFGKPAVTAAAPAAVAAVPTSHGMT